MKPPANQPHYSSRPGAKGVGVKFYHTHLSRGRRLLSLLSRLYQIATHISHPNLTTSGSVDVDTKSSVICGSHRCE